MNARECHPEGLEAEFDETPLPCAATSLVEPSAMQHTIILGCMKHVSTLCFSFLLVIVLLPIPLRAQSIAEPDIPTGLFERKDGKIVNAPAEDFALAKTYHSFKDKGALVAGQRITIMTHDQRYRTGEPVRVLHILEAVEYGKDVHVMGPKKVYDEYVDGKLVTPKGPGNEPYNGMVVDRPIADFNYEITTYIFSEPGMHTIQWKCNAYSFIGTVGLTSNVIKLEVAKP